MLRRSLTLALPAAALTLGVLLAQPAVASTHSVTWNMNETGGRVMHAAGAGPDGTIGAHVQVGVSTGAGRGYRFPAPAPTRQDPARLVTVTDNAAAAGFLDPHGAPITITVRLKPGSGQYNVLQKGQATTAGGYYKMEVNGAGRTPGIPDCNFGDGAHSAQVAWPSRIDNGSFHTVVCSKTATRVSIRVDGGKAVSKAAAIGSISNTYALSIGGKVSCNGGTVDCDYLEATVDRAAVSIS